MQAPWLPEAADRHWVMAASGVPTQPLRRGQQSRVSSQRDSQEGNGLREEKYIQLKGPSVIKDDNVDRKTELLSVWDPSL